MLGNRPSSSDGSTLEDFQRETPSATFDLALSEAAAMVGLPGPLSRYLLFTGMVGGVLILQVYFYIAHGEVVWRLAIFTGVILIVGGIALGARHRYPNQRTARLLTVSKEGIEITYRNGPPLALKWWALREPLWILDRRGKSGAVPNAECTPWGLA